MNIVNVVIDHLRRQRLCALRVAVIALSCASVAGAVLGLMT